MKLESAIGIYRFMSDIYGMDVLINEEVPPQEGEFVWEELYQLLTNSTEMGDVVDQENSENTIGTYDHFVGAEVCLPDEQGGGMMSQSHQACKGQCG